MQVGAGDGVETVAQQPLRFTGHVASVGAGGIPGGSVFLLFMVLENMGLPADQVALVVALCLGINPILDMFETCCNVTGDNVCTYIVAKKSGLVKVPDSGRNETERK